jgi:hypothetical protein
VQDVADDGHLQVGKILFEMANRVHVEQALRRMGVAPVAGIDHMHIDRARCAAGARRSGKARRKKRGARRTCRHASRPGCRSVSSSVSPLAVDERATSRLITSAERRLAAISKVVRVRVEFSKNRLNTLLPRSNGTFFTSRSETSRKLDAVSRICSQHIARQAIDRQQVIQFAVALSCGLCMIDAPPLQAAVGIRLKYKFLRFGQFDLPGAELGVDGQFAPAAVGEHRERTLAGRP